ncbi:MAG TPA: TRAP transporter small permease subunit [Gammaproteobacteria bacterium]
MERLGRRLEDALIVLLLGGLVVLASAQIVLRNVFSMGLAWSDGLVRMLVLWLALLGALAASRDGRQIALNVLNRLLPPAPRKAAAVAAEAFAAVVCGVLAWHALAFVRDSREFGDTVLNGYPAWWFQAILPVGFALLAWRHAARSYGRLVTNA